jgi:hypothetical protein
MTSPFMTMSIQPPTVLSELRITGKGGLVDTGREAFIDSKMFWDAESGFLSKYIPGLGIIYMRVAYTAWLLRGGVFIGIYVSRCTGCFHRVA